MSGTACSKSGRQPRPVVELDQIAAGTLRAGESKTVEVWITVAEGHHVQANPAAKEFLKPLTLSFPTSERLLVHATYPPPHHIKLEGAGWDLLTYDGKFAVTLEVTAPANAPPGQVSLDGVVSYQACNREVCLKPATAPVRLIAEMVSP